MHGSTGEKKKKTKLVSFAHPFLLNGGTCKIKILSFENSYARFYFKIHAMV
jgi:hypothetical protein